MELRQLKYFLAVADAQSFVSAANNLYISRQAVSKSIAQLEAELQVELFMRDSGGAYLTPAGIMFYERVRSMVLELEQLQSEIRKYGTQFRQVIRVAFSVGTLSLFENRIQQFIRDQQNTVIKYFECTPSECDKLLREHSADLVITSSPMTGDAFDSEILFQSPYGVLLREQSELDSMDQLEASDLRFLPLACFSDGQCEKFCAGLGLTPQYTGIDLFRLFSIAGDGQCATLMPGCLLPKQMPDLRWIPLNLQPQWTIRRVYLKSLENNILYHSAVDTFLNGVFRNPDARSV